MAQLGAKLTLKVLTIAVGIPVGIGARKLVERIWVAAGPDRPRQASDDGVQWADAISWAALVGISTAAADLLTRKGAEEIYHTLLGAKPNVTARPSASRHVRKAEPKYPEAIAPPT
jgi:hypothetical protein